MFEGLRVAVARLILPDTHRVLYPKTVRKLEEEKEWAQQVLDSDVESEMTEVEREHQRIIERGRERHRKVKRAHDRVQAAKKAIHTDESAEEIAEQYDHANVELVKEARQRAIESDYYVPYEWVDHDADEAGGSNA